MRDLVVLLDIYQRLGETSFFHFRKEESLYLKMEAVGSFET
jgi:hypothetical protein